MNGRPGRDNMADLSRQDCWKRQGVWGDKSCTELAHCRHCHHCEVYARVGRNLLDREEAGENLRRRSEQLAQPRRMQMDGGYAVLIFRIADQWFALSAGCFNEILDLVTVHSVPHRSGSVLRGLINVRGELQLCVNMGHFLAAEETVPPDDQCRPRILLAEAEGDRLAFHVHDVAGVHVYHDGELEQPPVTLPRERRQRMKGMIRWQHHHVAVLDEQTLFPALLEHIG